MVVAASIFKLLALSAVLVEASARIGAGVLPLLTRRPLAGWEKMTLGMFLAWGLAGTVFFGLALARLFMPGAIIAAFLLMLACSRAAWTSKFMLAEGMSAFKGLNRAGIVFLGLAGGFILYFTFPNLLVPDISPDTFTYHLGAPWQYLQSRGIQLYNVTWAFHLPMPTEMLYSIPLVLGDDRLARCISFLAFVAANIFVIGHCLKSGRRDAAWLAPLLVLAAIAAQNLSASCKSDMMAASLFVTGALLSLSGVWILSGLFMGACMAAKPVLLPMVAVWWLFRRPPIRIFLPMSAVLLLPSLGWMIKAYIATGNPFGLAAPWMESFDWGPKNYMAWKTYSKLEGKATDWMNLLPFWWESIRGQSLVMLLLLPGIFFPGRWRMAALACVLGQIVTLKLASEARFIFGSIWLLAVIGGLALCRLRRPWKAALYALPVLILIQAGIRKEFTAEPWREAALPADEYRKIHLTTFEEMRGFMAGLKKKRILTVGEFKTYLFPGRVLFNGALGETPVIWKMVHESENIRRLAVKFRQLGASHVWHNYITAELIGFHYVRFPWALDMARLYVEYSRRHQSIVAGSRGCDYLNGGFNIYEIYDKPAGAPQKSLWFLPGAETIFAHAVYREKEGDLRAALKVSLSIKENIPELGSAWNLAGRYYLLNEKPEEAFQSLRPFAEAGMVDALNLMDYVSSARLLGKTDLAEIMANKALELCPAHNAVLNIELALINLIRADREFSGGTPPNMRRYLEQTENYLDLAEGDLKNRDLRGRVRATAKFYWAMLHAATGSPDIAADLLNQACNMDPGNPLVPEWRELAREFRQQSDISGQGR